MVFECGLIIACLLSCLSVTSLVVNIFISCTLNLLRLMLPNAESESPSLSHTLKPSHPQTLKPSHPHTLTAHESQVGGCGSSKVVCLSLVWLL